MANGNGNGDGLSARARAVRELGAVGALIVITIGLLYFVLIEVRPALSLVPVIQADLAAHRYHEGENARLNRISCRALAKLANMDGNACEPVGAPRL